MNKKPLLLGTIEASSGNSALCKFSSKFLEQVKKSELRISVGSYIKIAVQNLWVIAVIKNLRFDLHNPDNLISEVVLVGELTLSSGQFLKFERGVSSRPLPGDQVFIIEKDELEQIYSPSGLMSIEIGKLFLTSEIKANLIIDNLLSKNFAIVGSTGTGKSTLAALIIHKIIDRLPNSHIIIFDPHNEYAAAFSKRAAVMNFDNLSLPYWLMNFEDHCEIFIPKDIKDRELSKEILAKVLLQARLKFNEKSDFQNIGIDSPVPYKLSDLLIALSNETGKLQKSADPEVYVRLKIRIEQLINDPRLKSVFNDNMIEDTMSSFMTRLMRFPAQGKPISIIDLSNVPSMIVEIIVSVLSRLVLEFAIIGRDQNKPPILLICDEAQRYLPSSNNLSKSLTLDRIAKEGRKYGVSLGLISQRPSELSETALSQCGTIIAMRLNNDRDQRHIYNAIPDHIHGMLDSIPSLKNKEAIICGEAVPIPMYVTINQIDADLSPSSQDPSYSKLWSAELKEDDILKKVIRLLRN